jgi:predicted acyltransferase
MSASAQTEGGASRLLSLDAFRGLTVAGMVLVNNPGTWAHIYWPLEHAEWDGWTPTDFVFPFFLFIVGVSITLSFARRVEKGADDWALFKNVLRRSLIIFGLGLLLSGFPFYNLHTIRIPGVLQRIAVCYFIASIIFIKTRWRTQAIIGVFLLFIYWIIMKTIQVPGYGIGDLSRQSNLAAYLDRTVFGRHTWKPDYDPEGILSTIPAIVTTLCGIMTGHLIRSKRTPLEKVVIMFVAGMAGVVTGWAWDAWFPINKALWTSSYVLFTAGMALQLLALFYWLIDVKGYKSWAKPFVVYGMNAIALFMLSGLAARVMGLITINRADGSSTSLQGFIYQTLFQSWLQPINASLAFAVCYVLVWLFLMWLLYRKNIFIKV